MRAIKLSVGLDGTDVSRQPESPNPTGKEAILGTFRGAGSTRALRGPRFRPNAMKSTLAESKAVLSRTPATLSALLQGLPEEWLEAREGEGTFSPRDVVGHLIHGERTDWVPRIDRILAAGTTKAFVPFDRFGFREAIQGASIETLLEELASLRASNLTYLDGLGLTPAQLSLEGRHPELGVVTLEQLLATWAVHDLNHIGQVVRVLSRRHLDTVGPWKAFLRILNE